MFIQPGASEAWPKQGVNTILPPIYTSLDEIKLTLDRSYIKELADRIHSIENKLESDGNLSQDDIERLFTTDRSRPSNGAEAATRKRPFSSISSRDLPATLPVRQTPWGSEPRTNQPALMVEDSSDREYGHASLAPSATPINADEASAKEPSHHASARTEDVDENIEIDEEAYQQYVHLVCAQLRHT